MNKKAVLCLNIGTPESTSVSSVRAYLKEFLSDPRVVDISWLGRQILLRCFILPFRPQKSAKAYRSIWRQGGSPLLLESQKFCRKLQNLLGETYDVRVAMRYGTPSLKEALHQVKEFEEVILFPMFPQYASSSTGSCLEYAYKFFSQQDKIPALKTIKPFYQEDFFVDAFVAEIKKQKTLKDWDHLLMSYHGLPQRQVQKSESSHKLICSGEKPCAVSAKENFCYRNHCYITSRNLAQKLGLSSEDYTVSFQSRLGRTPWIKPYTDEILPRLVEKGVKNLGVVCPSFVADCLETLEEIGIRAKEDWLKLGGESLSLVPCLNDSDVWVEGCCSKIKNLSVGF